MKKHLLYTILTVLFLTNAVIAEGLTFFVASDPHYGLHQIGENWYSEDPFGNNEKVNKSAIDDMNTLPGKKYPIMMGGRVAIPKGVLIPGDLTESGHWFHWNGFFLVFWIDGFKDDFDVNGGGRIKYPVYEGYGNHDYRKGKKKVVLKGIKLRNKSRATPVHTDKEGLHYSWDWEGIHFVNLNLYPGESEPARNSLQFLREDLRSRVGGSGQPIVLMFHYDIYTTARWWTEQEQTAFYNEIKDYNVIAMITGHTHVSRTYKWHGIPVFNAPQLTVDGTYHVYRINDGVINVVERSPKEWKLAWRWAYKSPQEFLEKRAKMAMP